MDRDLILPEQPWPQGQYDPANNLTHGEVDPIALYSMTVIAHIYLVDENKMDGLRYPGSHKDPAGENNDQKLGQICCKTRVEAESTEGLVGGLLQDLHGWLDQNEEALLNQLGCENQLGCD